MVVRVNVAETGATQVHHRCDTTTIHCPRHNRDTTTTQLRYNHETCSKIDCGWVFFWLCLISYGLLQLFLSRKKDESSRNEHCLFVTINTPCFLYTVS